MTLSIGLFTGIAAYFIEGSIGLLVQWRRDLMDVIEWPATSGNLAKALFRSPGVPTSEHFTPLG